MTDIEYIDVDAPEFAKSPKALLDHIKRLQELNATAAQERDHYRGLVVSAALRAPLARFASPERVKRQLLDDGVDPLDPVAVETWLEENADDYAASEDAPAPVVPSEDAAAHQRFQWDL